VALEPFFLPLMFLGWLKEFAASLKEPILGMKPSIFLITYST